MRDRLLAFAGSLTIAVAAVALTPPSLAAQAAKPAAKPAKQAAPPRTADGHPDFTGFYDVATMTPVERPNGAPLVLSDKEAAALETYEHQRQVKNDAPIEGNRAAPPVGGETTRGTSYLE